MSRNAEYSTVNDSVEGAFFSRVWKLTTPYWRSEEKGLAWILLIAVIALSLFSVAISVVINSWYRDFYNALEKKDLEAFTQQHVDGISHAVHLRFPRVIESAGMPMLQHD